MFTSLNEWLLNEKSENSIELTFNNIDSDTGNLI